MVYKKVCGKPSLCYTIFMILVTMNTCTLGQPTVPYYFVDKNDRYNSVVGIAVDNKPVSAGIIWSPEILLTSANPIESITSLNRVKIYTINGAYNRRRDRSISHMARDQAERNSRTWFTLGFDNRHAPHHDLLIVTFKENITGLNNVRRFPTRMKFRKVERFEPQGKFTITGFGFIDRIHVKQNINLEVVVYPVSLVLVDCHDWFPRAWGNFICLRNVEHFVGVSSGGPLFYNDVLVGIGCFSIRRGREGVLVFTDFRKYTGKMYYIRDTW